MPRYPNSGFDFICGSDTRFPVWSPDPGELQQILQLLTDSLSPDVSTMRTARREVKTLGERPDFNNYMAFIITELDIEISPSPQQRVPLFNGGPCVGLTYLRQRYSEAIDCLRRVGDRRLVFTAALGYFIMTDSKIALTRFAGLLRRLGELLDSEDERVCEGSLGMLHKICREYKDSVSAGAAHEDLAALLPKCLQTFEHTNPRVRACAITFVGLLLLNRTSAVMTRFDSVVSSLLQRQLDEDVEVQKRVLYDLLLLIEYHANFVVPYMHGIVEYLGLKMLQDDEIVAVQACCALTFCANATYKESLTPYLPWLLQIFLRKMKYSGSAIERLKEDGRDIRSTRGSTKKPTDGSIGGYPISDRGHADDNIFYEDNIRNLSANALHFFCIICNEELFPVLLPTLNEMLPHGDWKITESAIHAFGVIAEGCMERMAPHLPGLLMLFLNPNRNDMAPVRCAACWTLSQYYSWVLRQPAGLFLDPLIQRLLEWVLDDYEMVQEVACDALAQLEEDGKGMLVPYLNSILDTLYYGFTRYRRCRFYLLFHSLGVLADSVGSELVRARSISKLLKLLSDNWDVMVDSRINLFYRLDCLRSLAVALKAQFFPYHKTVGKRCLRLALEGMEGAFAEAIPLRSSRTSEKPFTTAALKTLGGIAEGLGGQMETFVSHTTIVALMLQCAADSIPEVREAAFYLLANIARTCSKSVYPAASSFIPFLLVNLNRSMTSLCKNATSGIGEIISILGSEVKPYASAIVDKLFANVDPSYPENLGISSALAIGHLAYFCPEEIAPRLYRIVQPCCAILKNIPSSEVKDTALNGIFRAACLNPDAVCRHFLPFLEAVLPWALPQDDFNEPMNRLLHNYRDKMWFGSNHLRRLCNRLPQELKERVLTTYDISDKPRANATEDDHKT
ncbi:hypothetical protein HPB50_006204 [Hyalomma asiaticum]|uniref:Uncharacterized protein n=1 Tax=Hyalomma asiaticum TaxID=266040 RepID=A0ACB7TD29_HYAAI|nr:hypothetical protein HPB50_006204 [Hyalomma asiaticum]